MTCARALVPPASVADCSQPGFDGSNSSGGRARRACSRNAWLPRKSISEMPPPQALEGQGLAALVDDLEPWFLPRTADDGKG